MSREQLEKEECKVLARRKFIQIRNDSSGLMGREANRLEESSVLRNKCDE